MTRSLTEQLVYRLHEKIQPWHLGEYFYIRHGRGFAKKYITTVHVGHCWGAFIWTRKRANFTRDTLLNEARKDARYRQLRRIYTFAF